MAEKKMMMMKRRRRGKRKNQYKHTSVIEPPITGHLFSMGFNHSFDADIVSARIYQDLWDSNTHIIHLSTY